MTDYLAWAEARGLKSIAVYRDVYVNFGGFERREVDEAQDVINEEVDGE